MSSAKAFGPSAILTPANVLSMARILATPVIIALVLRTGPATWLLWSLWTIFALSDAADGHLARWHGTTRSGAFLDPLADKFLVLGALFALAGIGYFSYVPVAVITAREVVMSLYRVRAGRHGVSVPARSLAKLKTLVQDVAIGFALFPPVGAHEPIVARSLLWLAMVLTVATGIEYYLDARRLVGARNPEGVTPPAHFDAR